MLPPLLSARRVAAVLAVLGTSACATGLPNVGPADIPRLQQEVAASPEDCEAPPPRRLREGSGWLAAAGGDLPMRIFGGNDFFPKARVILGSIKSLTGEGVGVFGMEFTGTVRASF